MHKALADALTLGGAMEFNVKMRWKHSINNKRLAGETVNMQGAFIHSPQFYDHSFLHYLNDLARTKGLRPVFDDVHLIGENNGEVFLSKYFDDQMVRNQKGGQDEKTSMCQCPTCIACMLKNNTPTRLFAPENDNNDNDNDNSNDADMPDSLPTSLPVALPLFIPPTSTASFVPPVLLTQLAYRHWMQPRPLDCCYMAGDQYCSSYAAYLRRKHSGGPARGKPPHDETCPVRRHFKR